MGTTIAGVIRHVLTTLGGGLVTGGAITQDELTTSAGAISTLLGVVWSVLQKKKIVRF